MRAAIVWMKLAGPYTTVYVTAAQYQAYRARLRERGGAAWMGGDNRIAALVEIGAIPYRERYEGRNNTDMRPTFEPRPVKGQPDYTALSAQCRERFPKVLAYLGRSAD